ncbi:MAG TPA: hypothetical protein VF802_03635 [Candidatus Limnocylindrales bacterium]
MPGAVALEHGTGGYRPGACNIGQSEVARRRAFGIAGLVVSVSFAVILLLVGAPPLERALVVAPLYGSFIGFYQARRRFCVRFAFAGMSNFGAPGGGARVADTAARRADRRAALQMVAICGFGAVFVAGVFALLPL